MKHYITAVLVVVVLLGTGISSAAQQSSVSRTIAGHTITFTFDKAYEVGTFVNGDYWVVGPVTITGMSPSAGGAMSNPTAQDVHGLLDKYPNYQSGLDLTRQLPYAADPGESIIKVAAVTTCKGWGPRGYGQCVGALDILTVLGSVPPGNGSNVFRPPYAGTNKPLRTTDNVMWERLPRVQAISDHPKQQTFGAIADLWSKPTADMIRSGANEMMRGMVAYNLFNEDYAASIGANYLHAVLSCFGTEDNSEKEPAVYALLQAGFDNYEAYTLGTRFGSGAGQHVGHKPRIVFAAAMYDEPQMAAGIRGAVAKAWEGWFQEDTQIYTTANSTTPLWGDFYGGDNHSVLYWSRFGYNDTDNKRTSADPYGYIDGPAHGIHGASYQGCCSTGPYMTFVFAQHLMPWMRYTNNDWEIVEYIDRVWDGRGFDGFDGGWWGSPDPCAPKTGTMGVHYGDDPENPGDCIKNGSGRFTADHGAPLSLLRTSSLATGLWSTFRDCADPDHPSYPCDGLGAPVDATDTIAPSISSVSAPTIATQVIVVFSEPVDQTSAETTANYGVSGGITVTGATLGSDPRVVTLTVSAMTMATGYTLTVTGVTDRAGNAMGSTDAAFTYIGQAAVLKIEAEDMTLDANLKVEERPGRFMIAVKSSEPVPTTGTATHTFTGISGIYDIVVSVAPENDGTPGIKLYAGTKLLLNDAFPTDPAWHNPAGTQHEFTVTGASLTNGEVIRLELTSSGTSTAAAFARTDWISFSFQSTGLRPSALPVSLLPGGAAVSPSPVTDRAVLRLPVTADSPVRVTDCHGKPVAEVAPVPGSRLYVWDGRNARPGLYMYSFAFKGQVYFGKFAKVQ